MAGLFCFCWDWSSYNSHDFDIYEMVPLKQQSISNFLSYTCLLQSVCHLTVWPLLMELCSVDRNMTLMSSLFRFQRLGQKTRSLWRPGIAITTHPGVSGLHFAGKPNRASTGGAGSHSWTGALNSEGEFLIPSRQGNFWDLHYLVMSLLEKLRGGVSLDGSDLQSFIEKWAKNLGLGKMKIILCKFPLSYFTDNQ